VLAASLGLLISSVFRSEPAVIATTVISAQLLAALGELGSRWRSPVNPSTGSPISCPPPG
jgi:hypothetical protein